MTQTIGVAIITKNEPSIKECIESFVDHVDQVVVAIQNDTPPEVVDRIKTISDKVEVHNFGDWIDDFAAKRNFSFAFLKTDWVLWADSDDTIYQPENLRQLTELQEPVGGIWFPYHYARDEFGNVTTIYERERLLRRKYGWIWKSRLHETVQPLQECKYVRTDNVIILHNHRVGEERHDRNFRLLNLMQKEDPNDKRVWLYLGHQHFAAHNWLRSAEWYLKFGSDEGTLPLERFQALCYCSKALREMKDDAKAAQVALAAISLFPQYKDGYLEAAQSYLRLNDIERAIHYASLSDVKEIIIEPPTIIFVNPLEYTFNKLALLSDCYLRKNDFERALHYLKEAQKIRPTKEIAEHIRNLEQLVLEQKVDVSLKTLAVHLLNNKEISKLPYLLHAVPYWYREKPDYIQLKTGIEHYTKDMKSEPQIAEDGNKSVVVNVANAINLKDLLKELDEKYDKVTVVAPYPTAEAKQINVLSYSDMENLIVTAPGRHITQLRNEPTRVWCEYDKDIPKGLLIRMYVGQGLEYWTPDTIKSIGCGGSETSAAWLMKGFANQGHMPILYAMDNQIWDGVLYRYHGGFQANEPSNLLISSRIPELFHNEIAAQQKWLWLHDVHCGDRLTPEIANRLNAIIVLSHWHCDFIKRVYPFLKDCEVVDLDDQDKTYEDATEGPVYFPDTQCWRKPKIAICGDAIDTARFIELGNIERKPHRFIWLSAPDRGLEQVLDMWPRFLEKWDDAELNIFYGWEYFDRTLYIESQRIFKEKIRELIKQPGVIWKGRVGQPQLAIELASSSILLYPPHSFRETYGIAFVEAQAAGVIPFYRKAGALGETVGQRGIALDMDMNYDQIAETVFNTIANPEKCAIIREKGIEYALKRTWDRQAEKMMRLYKMLEGTDAKD